VTSARHNYARRLLTAATMITMTIMAPMAQRPSVFALIPHNREVRTDRIRKSVGAENTFSSDLTAFEPMLAELQPLIDKVWRHCEDKGMRGRTVTLKVKFADFELISRSRTVAGVVGSRSEFENVSAELLKALSPMQKAVRLLGVSISGFKLDEIRGAGQIALEL
jgi:DNA polymerase IV